MNTYSVYLISQFVTVVKEIYELSVKGFLAIVVIFRTKFIYHVVHIKNPGIKASFAFVDKNQYFSKFYKHIFEHPQLLFLFFTKH
jgi:hypothetical protein